MNKRAIIYRTALAFLCLLSVVAFSYAWFNRETIASGNSMRYKDSIKSSAAGLDMSTYPVEAYNEQGDPVTDEGDKILYSNTAINVNEYTIPTEAFVPGKLVYFKTVVTNTNNYKVNADLFLYGTTYTSGLNGYLYFGVLSPMNTLKTYESSATGEIPLVRGYEIPANGTGEVIWYIYIDKACTASGQSVAFDRIRLYSK